MNVLLFEYLNWMIFDIVLLLTLGLITKETKCCFIYQNYSEVPILRLESENINRNIITKQEEEKAQQICNENHNQFTIVLLTL